MKPDKEADLAQRARDAWMDVELFRLVYGRLPNKEGDNVTKKTAKNFIDMCMEGKVEKKDKDNTFQFAFHVYASTNLAYKNDLKDSV